MRCTNCGGNANHCKCPMVYVKPRPMTFEVEPAVAVTEQTDTPHLPQAVTAEPERPTTAIEPRPFERGETVRLINNPLRTFEVKQCIRLAKCFDRRWAVLYDETIEGETSTQMQLAAECERVPTSTTADAPPFAPKDTAELLDNPGTYITVADCEKTVCHGIIPWIVTDTEGGRHYAKGLRRVEVCHIATAYERMKELCPPPQATVAADELPPADWTATELYWHIKRMRANHTTELNEAHSRITTITSDRDGARRALAGNIEVTERQLKEQYTTIERLSALYRAVCDLPTGGNDDGTMEIKCSVLRRIAVVFDSLRDLKISYLQPGTEAAPNGPR